MKSLFYLIIATTLVLVSCKKENIEPNPQVPTEINQEIRLYGKWVLVGGSMYVENIETGKKTKYNHFGPGKTTSSLNCGGSEFAIEVIELNTTTWSFYEPPMVPGFGNFVLNGDTQNPYGFNVTKNNWTIMENPQSTSANMQMGGSARPIRATICDYSDSTVYFYVQESSNDTCYYISELKFKKIESW